MYRKYVRFPWPPVVAAHDRKRLARHCIAVAVIGATKTILIPRIQLCPSDPTVPFKLSKRRFPIKIAFAMTIDQAQGQIHHRLFFHIAKFYVTFSWSSSFNNVAVAIIEGHRQRTEMLDS